MHRLSHQPDCMMSAWAPSLTCFCECRLSVQAELRAHHTHRSASEWTLPKQKGQRLEDKEKNMLSAPQDCCYKSQPTLFQWMS